MAEYKNRQIIQLEGPRQMGFFRLWLALVVVCGHVPNNWPRLLSGTIAVSSFYVISGFYMQLILAEGYRDKWKFWLSRGLKIYPLYWLVSLCTLAYYSIFEILPQYAYSGNSHNGIEMQIMAKDQIFPKIFYLFSNILIFGQALGLNALYNQSSGQMEFYSSNSLASWSQSDVVKGTFLALNGQSWSLDIELMYYLVAPFLLRATTRFILIVTFVSVGLRIALGPEYWTSNSHFVLEIALFNAGALCYRLTKNKTWKSSTQKTYLLIIVPITIIYSLIHPFFAGTLAVFSYWGFLFFSILSVPIYFIATKTNKIDRWLGDLSYGIYMWHFLIIGLVHALKIEDQFRLPVVLFFSIAACLLTRHLIELPVEKFRHTHLTDKTKTVRS
jgi:peptidoglycan/LPS O-acetylase OafA/YrhL